jgi:hypothetical protein
LVSGDEEGHMEWHKLEPCEHIYLRIHKDTTMLSVN